MTTDLERLIEKATAMHSGPAEGGFRFSLYFDEPEDAHAMHGLITDIKCRALSLTGEERG